MGKSRSRSKAVVKQELGLSLLSPGPVCLPPILGKGSWATRGGGDLVFQAL